MTLLKKEQSEGSSYLEIAHFLRSQGDGPQTDKDLTQLFRRVAFNVAVSNRDDHLRNHGFVLYTSGWQLAPAFDMNATIDKEDHVLNIDDADNRPNLSTLLKTAPYYGLTAEQAQNIIHQVMEATASWQEEARRVGIGRADLTWMAGAFISG